MKIERVMIRRKQNLKQKNNILLTFKKTNKTLPTYKDRNNMNLNN